MTATDADLQELVSALQVQLREMMRGRDAYRAWAEGMPPLPASGMLRVGEIQAVEDWMRKRPADGDADSLYMDV